MKSRSPSVGARSIATALTVVAFLTLPHDSAAAPTPDYAVKAAYLAKFALFVEWPDAAFDSATSPINVCIAGTDPFGNTLNRLVDGERVGNRPLVIRRMVAAMRNSGCHVLYVGGSPTQSVAQALQEVAGDGVLTVTDASMAQSTGILDFVIANGRVRFTVDEGAASMNRITISSHLLGLALSVKPRT